ncbi:hypothetical protein MPSEU_000576800 [Mayamaea pseudoterrestris]|nr:hypothetical protein MPSEU_000576800 [Mayamaea pseudoterrestris]
MRASSLHFEDRHPRGERAGLARSGSREEGYGSNLHDRGGHHQYMQQQQPQYGYERPAKKSFASSPQQQPRNQYPSQSSYPHPPPQYPRHMSSPRTSRGLQAVVTSSFSEEETMRHRMLSSEEHYETRERVHEMERESHDEREEAYYHEYNDGSMSTQNHPHASPASRQQQYIQKSYSAGYQSKDGPLKRSYYHHSHLSEGPSTAAVIGQLPADFMPPALPPKRIKISGGSANRGEIIVTPRTHHHPEWYAPQGSWEAEQDAYSNLNRRNSRSFPPQQQPAWAYQQHTPMRHLREHELENVVVRPKMSQPVDESEEHRSSAWQPMASPPPQQWDGASSRVSLLSPPVSTSAQGYRYWETRQEQALDHSPRGTFETHHHHHSQEHLQPPQYYNPSRQRGLKDKMQLVVDAAAATGDHIPSENRDGLFLLALPQDRVSLSETLCVVRENIEVFTASQADVDAPAPGRKHAVVVGQVGLRCIHCRYTTKCSDRVKRAVCYPSSIKRIYRTVIDMKLDHFSQCKFVPETLKFKLQQLKSVQTRSTGTTMQYFIRAALALGMEDSSNGVRLAHGISTTDDTDTKSSLGLSSPQTDTNGLSPSLIIHRTDSIGSSPSDASKANDSMMSVESFDSNGCPDSIVSLDKYYDGCVPLSLPEDHNNLSPLRCFLRQQVCAFSATEEDIAVRVPTTFSIAVGQTGIGCIHCVRCPPKQRSNRAVCFPFSIGRIYQSVADIQRFHFTECRNLPSDVKEKFLELQSASSKGSKGLATRQYWVASAHKIGLVDTSRGIRFGRDPLKPEETKAFSLDILAQAAFCVTTADKPIVIPEDKEAIAEFLYVVMEQLQPCQFTEADRNKRRLKEVGCTGVECKHCAGQVDSRKFFWSSVSAVESNFVSVHTHMLECRMVPDSLKQKLIHLKSLRKEQTVALKTGSQKAFFARVWQRLHDDDNSYHHVFEGDASPSTSKTSHAEEEDRDDAPSRENKELEEIEEYCENVVGV